jgi:hypothetical protein
MLDTRSDPSTRITLPVLIGIAAVLALIWLLGTALAANAVQGLILLVAGLAVFVIFAKTVADWRGGLYLAIVWLLFEDFIRKYLGNSMYVYFGKDLLIGAAYLALIISRWRDEKMQKLKVPFKYALGLFVLLGFAQVFNSDSPSVWYGILGLKLYFWYVPLMFVGYAMLRTEKELRKFLVLNMVLASIISLVGIGQTVIGQNFLNPHSGSDIDGLSHLTRLTPSGLSVARPPGVFVSEGRFFDYLTLIFILGMGTTGYLLLRSRQGRKIVFPALALVAVAGVLSGGRGVFVWLAATAIVLSLGMIWGAPPKLAEGYRLVKAIRRSFVFIALAMALAVVIFPEVVGARLAFYRETIALDSPDSETVDRAWNYPVGELLKVFADRDWAIGHGIGTASLGSQYVSRIMEVQETTHHVESGYGVLILELGIAGLFLWLLLSSAVLYSALKVLMKLRGTWAFPVALSICWFTFYLLFARTYAGIAAYQDFIFNAYLWLLLGMLFRLPELVRQEEPESYEPRQVLLSSRKQLESHGPEFAI